MINHHTQARPTGTRNTRSANAVDHRMLPRMRRFEPQSRMANIADHDLRDLADFGALLLGLDNDGIEGMLAGDELKEMVCDDEDQG